MNLYNEYIKEIEERKGQGLHPKPIDSAELLSEIIEQIKEVNSPTEKIVFIFLYIIHCLEQPVLLVKKPIS
jgi:aconitate hydratase 2/2-methylisocitrate dehydratase